MPDFTRIKSNITSMIAQNAPEKDIDAYVASEGTTPEELQADAGQAAPTVEAVKTTTNSGVPFASGTALTQDQVQANKTTDDNTNEFTKAANNQFGGQWGLDAGTRKALGANDSAPTGIVDGAAHLLNNLPANTADLALRAYQGLGVGTEVAARGVDDLFNKSGLADLLGHDGNKFLPGSAAMALMEAFPAAGAESGLETPNMFHTPEGDTISPEIRAKYNQEASDLFKQGATKDQMNVWAKERNLTPYGDDLDEAIQARDAAVAKDPGAALPLEDVQKAANDLHPLATEAANFKTANPEPVATDVFPTEASEAAKNADLQAQLEQEATPFKGRNPEDPAPQEAVAPEASAVEDATDPATISKKQANALFKDQTTTPKAQTAAEWEAALQQAVNDFKTKNPPPEISPSEGPVASSDTNPTPKAAPTSGEAPTAPTDNPSKPTTTSEPPTPEAIGRFTDALDNAKPLNAKQQAIYAADKSTKAKQLLAAQGKGGGEAAAIARRAILKGASEKVKMKPLREDLSQGDIDSISNHIDTNLKGFDSVNAHSGFNKLLEGHVPTSSEIGQLSKVLPKEAGEKLITKVNRANSLPEDWLTSWHYAALLSGVKSLEHNVVGHTIGSLLNNVTEAVASTGGSIAKRLGVNDPSLKTLTTFRDRMNGYANILSDGALYKGTKDAFRKNNVVDAKGNAAWSQTVQLPGILTFPERFHSASYTFFGETEKAANLYQAAAKQARNEGLVGDKAVDRIKELVLNPPEAMAKEALDTANAIRFMGKGDLSQMIQGLTKTPEPDQALKRIIRFGFQNIAPFANIAEQKMLATVRYLPILDKLDPFARAQWKSGIGGKQSVISRYMIGMTALTLGAKLGISEDSDLVGEIPVLNLLKVASKAMDTYRNMASNPDVGKAQAAADSAVAAFAALTNTLQDETSLKSIGDFFVKGSGAKGAKNAQKYWDYQAAGWLPYSALSREVAKNTDPEKRDISSPSITGGLVNAAKAIIPGASETLPTDRIGQNIMTMKEKGASPKEIKQYISSESHSRKNH